MTNDKLNLPTSECMWTGILNLESNTIPVNSQAKILCLYMHVQLTDILLSLFVGKSWKLIDNHLAKYKITLIYCVEPIYQRCHSVYISESEYVNHEFICIIGICFVRI